MFIQRLAEQCVKCGLCLPQCPTYALSHLEGHSPRGRIALMADLAERNAAPSAEAFEYLDACLMCRRCEAVCPSLVQYGELYDRSMQQLTTTHDVKLYFPFWLRWFTTQRWLQRLVRFILHKPKYKKRMLESTSTLGRVALLTGCATSAFESDVIAAAQNILQAFGFEVVIPPQQTCCGGLHQHAGHLAEAKKLQKQNAAIFNAAHVQAVIVLASGCAMTLQESQEQNQPPYHEICEFLAGFLMQQGLPKHLTLKPLACKVAIHTPCSMQNVLKKPHSVQQLLSYIPDIELVAPLTQCCGGAGTYWLRQPEFAKSLQKLTLTTLTGHDPDIIVTTNIGCRLALERASAKSWLHPVILFANQLNLVESTV